MKTVLEKNISRGVLAVACGLWLAGGFLWAQQKSEPSTNAAASTPSAIESAQTAEPVEAVVAEAGSNATTTAKSAKSTRHGNRGSGNPKVVIGNNAEVRAGETVEAFVVIGGNGVVKGKVLDSAVVIGGNLDISGEVNHAAVVVLGNIHVRSNAVVNGDVVSVGGKKEVEDGAIVRGQTHAVEFGNLGLPQIEPLKKWVKQCLFKLRPLAPQVGWVWIVFGVFFLVYLLVAVVLNRPVQTCVGELTRRPATTFLMGLLAKLVTPVILLILAATGIGLIVVPFVLAALLFGAIIGKVALLEYLGDALRRATGANEPLKPVFALCAGTLLVAICYNIPVLGLVTFAVLSVWGLGVAVTVAFGSLKRESPEKPTPPAPVAPVGQPGFIAPMPGASVAPPVPQNFAPGTTFTANIPEASAAPAANLAAPVPPTAPATISSGGVPEALAYPRASFWERMGAGFLDLVIVGILTGMGDSLFDRLPGHPPYGLLVTLAYFAGMWAWKGRTVGGAVLNLKVVRLDNGPLTFPVALVRGLVAALSALVFFLGFLWIAWDPDKQGWHDRIAGTVVIRLPRGTPLVCL